VCKSYRTESFVLYNIYYDVCVADIVEKETVRLDSLSNRLATIPLKAEEFRERETSDDRDLSVILSRDFDDRRNEDRFNSQRENFADLYVSRPVSDNGDVIYGDVGPTSPDRYRTADGDDNYNHFEGDTSKQYQCK